MSRKDFNKMTDRKKVNSTSNSTNKKKEVKIMQNENKIVKVCINYRKSISPTLSRRPNVELNALDRTRVTQEFKCLRKHCFNVIEENFVLGYAIIEKLNNGETVPYVALKPTQLVADAYAVTRPEEEAHDLQDNIDDNSDEIINEELDSLLEE